MAGDPRVQEVLDRALAEVAGARSTSDLEQIRVRVLGRAGQLTTLLRSLGGIPAAERPKVGEQANRAKAEVEAAIAARLEGLKVDEHRKTLAADRPDLTLPGRRPLPGAVHPLTRVTDGFQDLLARIYTQLSLLGGVTYSEQQVAGAANPDRGGAVARIAPVRRR